MSFQAYCIHVVLHAWLCGAATALSLSLPQPPFVACLARCRLTAVVGKAEAGQVTEDETRFYAEQWQLLTPPGTDVEGEEARRQQDPSAYTPPLSDEVKALAGRAFIARSRVAGR